MDIKNMLENFYYIRKFFFEKQQYYHKCKKNHQINSKLYNSYITHLKFIIIHIKNIIKITQQFIILKLRY